MREKHIQHHIDALIALLLFGVFAVCVLAVLCQNAAEIIRRGGGVENAVRNAENHVLAALGPVNAADGRMAVYYDADWSGVSSVASDPYTAVTLTPGSAVYRLMAEEVSSDVPGLGKAHIAVTETGTGETLFELDVAWQEEVGAHG